MRVRNAADGLSVHAIAGTNVVLFGLDIDPGEIKDLLGFEIERTGGGGKERYLYGGMQFRDQVKGCAALIPPFADGSDPGRSTVGAITRRRAGPSTHTRSGPGTVHPGRWRSSVPPRSRSRLRTPPVGFTAFYFNRGVAGSDAYNRRFDEHRCFYLLEKYGRARWTPFIRPDQVPGDAAWNWLSRGLKEALLEFIGQADGPRYALRVAAYELDYLPVLAALARALEAQVDVQIVHHAKQVRRQELRRGGKTVEVVSLDPVGLSAQAAIRRVGIKEWPNTTRWQKAFFDRTDTTISHNKFIVLLKDNKPVAVWTGSTNFTAGGIFGQSNVGHIVRDKDVAARYLAYWNKLKTDPPRNKPGSGKDKRSMYDWNVQTQPDLTEDPAPGSIATIFSPRRIPACSSGMPTGWGARPARCISPPRSASASRSPRTSQRPRPRARRRPTCATSCWRASLPRPPPRSRMRPRPGASPSPWPTPTTRTSRATGSPGGTSWRMRSSRD